MKNSHSNKIAFQPALSWLRCLSVACLFAGTSCSALAANNLTDNGNGTVTDPTTGLIWMQCAIGQTWSGGNCSGTLSAHTFADANAMTGKTSYAGQLDWRLPNVRELLSLVEVSRSSPAIYETAFPNRIETPFWSSTAFTYSSSQAWNAQFRNSSLDAEPKSAEYLVRLVRGGQSFAGLLNPARPTTDYIIHDNGTVTHTPTGLMWQRCAKGQSWTGGNCSGSPAAYTHAAALSLTDTFAGRSDWRLPTVSELNSLIDYTLHHPAVNTALFPAAPYRSWSSTVIDSNYADVVDLQTGEIVVTHVANTNSVFFVRSASFSASILDGIYQWDASHYLSVHQNNGHLIATLYFNIDSAGFISQPTGGGRLVVPQLDVFELFGGPIVGATASVTGARHHQACNVDFDLTANSDSSLTVRSTAVSNTPMATAAGMNCAAVFSPVGTTFTIPRIF